jgi:hypothetical protein
VADAVAVGCGAKLLCCCQVVACRVEQSLQGSVPGTECSHKIQESGASSGGLQLSNSQSMVCHSVD